MPEGSEPRVPTAASRRLRGVVVTVACIAVVAAAAGVALRVRAGHQAQDWTHERSIPTVAAAVVGGSGVRDLTLPGKLQALNGAQIYARTNGYLKRLYVDIGAPVKTGQVLAEIDTPELDQQVIQARADLATAQANERLARTTAERWRSLLEKGVVSPQAAEEKAGELAARTSAAASARANLGRLLELARFKRLVAPFDGVVTERNVDVGALVSAGVQAGRPLFAIADERRLRVYVNVPQYYSGQIRPGLAAQVSAPEYPGETFPGVLVRASPAIDGASGAMLAELQLDNPGGRLKPGAFVQAAFGLAGGGAVSIPATAVIFQKEGLSVAVLGADSRVTLRKVTIVRDLGPAIEIGSGLKAGERIVDSPPEALRTGDQVRVAAPAPAGKG